jgi:hypothetical protein
METRVSSGRRGRDLRELVVRLEWDTKHANASKREMKGEKERQTREFQQILMERTVLSDRLLCQRGWIIGADTL